MDPPTQCRKHLNKKIFYSKEHARVFMTLFFPSAIYRVYPCPIYSHFHVLNKSKRNNVRRLAKLRNKRLREANQ